MANGMASYQKLDWSDCFGSLCDAPMKDVSFADFGPGHPVQEFHQYWTSLAGDGAPPRKALKPEQVRNLLRWIMILERSGDESAPLFIVRLHGTAASAMMYGNLTGRELSEFTSGACYTSRLNAFRQAILTEAPIFGAALIEAYGRPRLTVKLGIFPFTGDNGAHPQLLVVAAPDDPELQRLL